MSEIGKIERPGDRRIFPSKRRSSDPMQPQSGEVDFDTDLESFDEIVSSSVQSTEKTDQSIIRDDGQRQRVIRRSDEHRENEGEEEKTAEQERDEANSLIDLEV